MSKIMLMLVAGLMLTACGADGGGTAPAAEEAGTAEPFLIDIVADDFSFGVPETVPAGPVEIRLENLGDQPHQALIYRLNDGVTYDDYVKAVIEDDSEVPALSERLGGANYGLGTGESQVDKQSEPYEPGTYAAICFVRDPKSSKTHLELGMIASFTVE